MDYLTQKKIFHLSNRIKIFKKAEYSEHKDQKIIIKELEWRISDLVSALIQKSELTIPFPTKALLKTFYDKQPDRSFTLESLFEKFWLREIMDRIEIPYSIKSAFTDLNKPFPKEFKFALIVSEFFQKENKTELNSGELQTLLSFYHSINPGHILTEKILHDKGILTNASIDSKNYVFRDFAQYLLFQASNQDQLSFIREFWNEYLDMDKKFYRISKHATHEIIRLHRILYPQCPDIDQWKKVYAFQDTGDYYLFKFTSDSNRTLWKTLSEEIAGKLWNSIMEDQSCSENNKLNLWLDKLSIQQELPYHYLSHIPSDKRNKFLTLAHKAMFNEQDIIGCENEINKLLLEKSTRDGSRHLYYPPQVSFTKEQNMAEKYRITELMETYDDTIFYEEHCRERLAFLLTSLIKEDRIAGENVEGSVQTIHKILEESHDKPFLLWQTCSILLYHRPEVIPYLLPFKGSAELAFILIKEIEINRDSFLYKEQSHEEEYEKLRNELILEGFDILLAFISSHQKELNNGSILINILSDFAIDLFTNKHYKYNNRLSSTDASLFYERFWHTLSSYRSSHIVFSNNGSYKPVLLLIMWEEFLAAINKYTPKESFNEFYDPHLWHFDLLTRFLKVVNELPEADKILLKKFYAIDSVNIEGLICKLLHQKYLDMFTISEIKFRWTIDSNYLVRPVEFLSRAYGVERIDWTIFYTLLEPSMRTEFLQQAESSFDLSECNNDLEFYRHPQINNSIHRLRFHLKVLLKIHNDLADKSYNVVFEILDELVKRITALFFEYSKTDFVSNQVNIFRDTYDQYCEFKLFNRLVENIILFKPAHKKKILDHLVTTDQFDKLLYISNLLTSKGDLDFVLSQLTIERLEKYLQQNHSYFELETALVHAINNPDLVEVASVIISSVESKKWHIDSFQQYEHDRLLFHIKLLFYFRKKEIQKIKDLPIPTTPHVQHAKFIREDRIRKRYHEILFIYYEGQTQKALDNIIELILEDSDNPMLCNLKFSIRIKLAKALYQQDAEEGKIKIKDALVEYGQAERKFKEGMVSETTLIESLYNKMESYHLLELNQQFDASIVLLSKEELMREDFSKLIIDNKLIRRQYTEAALLCEELTQYHMLRSRKVPEFINELNNQISSSDEHIESLKKSYKNILTLPAYKRFLVLPGSVSDHQKDLGKFLLGELVRAATALQRKIYSLLGKEESVKAISEDKITDLLELLLNARLSAWDMNWSSQSRVGTTGNSSNELARADLSLAMDGKTIVAEALRIYSYSSVESQKDGIIDHILKSFNQTANRNFLYQLSYFQGDNFETNWDSYKRVVSTINFPDRFKQSSGMEIIPEKSSPDLMVAYTKHEQNVFCYYVFVNLNYTV